MSMKEQWNLTLIPCFCLLLAAAGAAFAATPDDPDLPPNDPDKPSLELCDGVDNDGDGEIDEGFDVDRDGVARCCSCDPFFATVADGNRIEVHSRSCTDSAFSAGVQPAFEDFSGATIVQLHAVADFDNNCGLDIVWRDRNTSQRKMTSCRQGEWQTTDLAVSDLTYFGGGDLNSDGTPDLAGWDATCCFTTANAGTTALNVGGGVPMFTPEIYGAYDISTLNGSWLFGRAYNLEDLDGDSFTDVMFWEYSSGGSATTQLHWAPGLDDGTFGATVTLPNTIPNQPQNFGDLGDIDGDGCADWVGGPDDDGDKGSVYALFGDCAGNFSGTVLLVDACPGACPGSGTAHGSGMSQLYDWNCNGRLDLITSHVVSTAGSTATFQYWPDSAGPATSVINAAAVSTAFASPLRNYDRNICQ